MRVPEGTWLRLIETNSTQAVAARALVESKDVAVIIAESQSAGRGRFDRKWISPPGSCLAASLIFRHYADHKQPWLIAMALATAAAGVLHCQVQWPNDLVLEGKKLGGILTEMLKDSEAGLVPVVGVGVNLGPIAFPADLVDKATTMADHGYSGLTAEAVLTGMLERLRSMPEPETWAAVDPVWRLFDATPGKRYKLFTGEEATAIGIGPAGELLCSVDGESTTVMAADAYFGAEAESVG